MADKNTVQTEAIKILQEAVAADTQNNLPDAIQKYSTALQLLTQLLQLETDPEARFVLQSKHNEYTSRVATLKALNTPASPPAAFPAPGGRPLPGAPVGATSSAGGRPLPGTPGQASPASQRQLATTGQAQQGFTAYDGAIAAIEGARKLNELDNQYQVSSTIGTTVVATAQSAYQINQEYKVTETVGTAIVQGANKASEINEEYKVTETLGNAAVAGYNGAVELNDEYKITERTALALQNAYDGAVQMNEEYQITEKISEGLQQGWAATVQFNEDYKVTEQIGAGLASAWGSFAAWVAPADPNAPAPAQPPAGQ